MQMSSVCWDNYSFSPTIPWKSHKAFEIHSDSFFSDDYWYLQPRFDEAAKLFYKLGGRERPDHGSLQVVVNEYMFMASGILHQRKSPYYICLDFWKPGRRKSY